MKNKHTIGIGLKAIVTFVLIWLMSQNLIAQNSRLVFLEGGKLTYTPYAMKNQGNAVNKLPDFSHAGYMGGGVKLPFVPVVKRLSPVSGDNTQAIQKALDEIAARPLNANGFRGALLLKAGRYEVASELFIRASGVVLRGQGQGKYGTILYASAKRQHTLINVLGDTTSATTIEDAASTQRITNSYVPVGTRQFNVADASGFRVGDIIYVKRTPNQFWINDLGMDRAKLCQDKESCVGWTTAEYTIGHERVITAISGNKVTINIPIVDVMETKYGGGEIVKVSFPGRISKTGVENLRVESAFASNTDEAHLWSAVGLFHVENSWVKKVTAQYIGYACVLIGEPGKAGANFNTIEECATLDFKSQVKGGRRYSFTIDKGLGNLIQRCYTTSGRHDFETGSQVTGPNVFLDCYSDDTRSDIGPHHRWSTGILFDNIRGGEIRVRNRGKSGTGHGWVGNTIVFWNLTSTKRNITVASPKGGNNFGIGCTATSFLGGGFWESQNQPVVPRSLYLQQLKDRKGFQAVNRVTLPEQRTGNIYELLANWKGQGALVKKQASSTRLTSENDPTLFVSNPFTNQIEAQIDLENKIYRVTVFDLMGRKVTATTINQNRNAIDLGDLKRGVYLVKMESETHAFSQKIYKQ
ncbi:MAG: T9SS type A sorting domain-containing protein [Bacteroidota bacterium]